MASIAPVPSSAQSAAPDYKSVALLSAAHLCDDINQGVVPAMLPFFIAAYHLTYAAAAGLVMAQTLASSVVQPLFGMLADRSSSAWLVPVGLSLAGIGVALSGIAPGYWLIFSAIAVSGLGISAFHPEAARRVRFLSGSRRATTMSLFTVGGMAGFALGPLLITPTLITLGTRGAVLLAIPVLAMSLVLTYNLPRLSAHEPSTVRRPAGSVIIDGEERWADFWRLGAVVVLRSTVFLGLDTFLPLYWTGVLGGTKTGGGMALTAMLAAVTVGTLLGGRLADRYGRKIVIAASLGLSVPLMLMFLDAHRIELAAVMLVPIGVVLAAPSSVITVLGQDYLPNRAGLAAGLTLGLSMTIGGLLAPVLGSIADHYGLHTMMFLIAIIPSLAFAMSLTLHETAGETVTARPSVSEIQASSSARTSRA